MAARVSGKVLERHLEAHFAKECKALSLVTLKLALRFSTGWPDRIVLLKDGAILWVELKTLTGIISARQSVIHKILISRGHTILVLRTKDEISRTLRSLDAA